MQADQAPRMFCRGRYCSEQVLHPGDYSTVYLARDLRPRRAEDEWVVIKALKATYQDLEQANAGDPIQYAFAMFETEVGSLAQLRHENIVHMYSSFEDDLTGELCIVLEYLHEARSLERLFEEASKPSLIKRIQILQGVAEALNHAHQEAIVHRDVTPNNVLVDLEADSVKLADFGISRILTAYTRRRNTVTLRNFATESFAPPERRQGQSTTAGDWYSFGVLMACVLTWKLPEDDLGILNVSDHLEDFTLEMAGNPLTAEVENLIVRCLNPSPSERPHAHRIMALLHKLRALVDTRPQVTLGFSGVASRRLREGHWSIQDVLDDLNSSPRGKLVMQHPHANPPYKLELFGPHIRAVVHPRGDEGALDLVDYQDNTLFKAKHDHEREEAQHLHVEFTSGFSSSSPQNMELVRSLRAHAMRQDHLKKQQAVKEGFLKASQAVLHIERQRLTDVQLGYGWMGSDSKLEHSAVVLKPNTLVEFAVFPFMEDPDFDEVEDIDWKEVRRRVLSEEGSATSVVMDGHKSPFGTVENFDSQHRVLTVRITRKVKVPKTGGLKCINMSALTPILRQERALQRFIQDETHNPNLADLVIHPHKNYLEDLTPIRLTQKHLQGSDIHQRLVQGVLAARDVFVLQGPPGTGKTTTIIEIMAQILLKNPHHKILLTSQANEAVNNALERLEAINHQGGHGWRIQRFASQGRMEESGFPDVDTRFRQWIQDVKTRSAQHLTALQAEGTSPLLPVLQRWQERLGLNAQLKRSFVESVQVFGMTCLRVPALKKQYPDLNFDWVIVDEAGKATPAEVLVSLVEGKRFLLVGDHKQLPPFLDQETEEEVMKMNLSVQDVKTSLFERLFTVMPHKNKEVLRTQYRMHPSISDLVSHLYYQEEQGLIPGLTADKFPLALQEYNRDNRVFWLDVPDASETRDADTGSWRNSREANAIVKRLKSMEQEARRHGVQYSVGVITAYASQKKQLSQLLMPTSGDWQALKIRIDTVDAFQGKEDDIIIYSMVRSSRGNKTFISDRRRLNVAFSRAKRLLIIAGSLRTLKDSPQIQKVIQWIPPQNILTQRGSHHEH